jgi:predicted DNA-binding transcriptional regulator AlpA
MHTQVASDTALPSQLASDIALPKQVASALGTSEAGLAQMRYRGTGPKFCRVGARKVVYRWSDVRSYLDANTFQRTDDPRGGAA